MKIMSVIFKCIMFLYFASVGLSQEKLPSGMSQHQYCLGCIATVKELEKALSRRRLTEQNRESKVMEMMEKICNAPNFVEYEYSPPKTVKACELLMERHEEDLETAFVKKQPDIENLICFEISRACEGIDPSKKEKSAKFADIDLSSGTGDDVISKTVKVDPGSSKFVVEDGTKDGKKTQKEGKTLSKSDKKKKDKTKKKKKTETEKKTDGKGKQKGSINHLNVDINDPNSMEKVMAQIKDMTDKLQNKKEEL